MTERLFLDEPTLPRTDATVIMSGPEGIVLDRTVFYARGGGQPGDTGMLWWEGGEIAITDTVKGEGEAILHIPAPDVPLPHPGMIVSAEIDWDRRHRLMRMHTAMHLLCSLIKGAAVTGGSVGADKSRLDFDLPNPPPKDEIEAGLNALIAADYPVAIEWVDEVGVGHRSRPGAHDVGAASAWHGPAAADADRRGRIGRPAALRRNACVSHRRNWADPGGEDREQGQAEPPDHHRAEGSLTRGASASRPRSRGPDFGGCRDQGRFYRGGRLKRRNA